ncbi:MULTISPECIES: arginine--tRNA ligase [Pacificibacter]|uniref:arginine--tRNA ligase n=1 Tax=Pacificibacter TaxID=1042323 RepID=UPI001C096C03|nr:MULTISPECIES: arginine--tRNA ligase [Pacificibacter]MBU2936957.1 arginine--tRNA ligase [Pacificibacter marinus]MDO6614951.1 arginine--tRNA ligase [Pacificibacter sp. 1_MG-2023]
MNLFADIRALVINSLTELTAEGLLPDGLSFDNVAVEPPRDALHGDMATNAAMVLAKPAKSNPRAIAQALADKLSADPRIDTVDVAGPGFINLRLSKNIWGGLVTSILTDTAFGKSALGAGKKVNVEYVSANPTGPMHVGHTRGAVFGDALASLLDYAGYDVTREYYINDGGGQVDTLARSVYERYREANGLSPEIAEGLYPGDYLVPVGQALKEKYGDSLLGKPESDWLADFRLFSTDAMMDMIRADLAMLGVKMDNFFSEKALYDTGLIESAIAELKDKGLIYRGTLEPPKGQMPDDWEPREQTLFKSTDHGDDVDRAIQKSDGAWTYFAPDIAYHYDKVQRGYDEIIDIFGADHGGYVKRMKAAVSALSDGKVACDIKLVQLVKLFKNGAEFKMSKRAGTFVTLNDVVEQAGKDVTRFIMLTRKNDASLDFDFDKVLEQSKDNPVFYVQYAHARVCSVLRKAEAAGVVLTDTPQFDDPAEITLARKLADWPRQVEIAAKSHEPHRIAFYLYELASDFHALWNKGNDKPELRFLQDDLNASSAKIALPRAVAVVISAGLGILGVTPAQEMR